MVKNNVVVRADTEWDRLVFAEILIPEVPNVYGDYWTEEAVREAAYAFLKKGFVNDVEHDLVDRPGLCVVESFIAREGDPTFIKGSWVVGMHVDDDDLWQKVLDGDINGFSYEAIVDIMEAVLEYTDDNFRQGYTEPDIHDGHRHSFAVWVDDSNRPVVGGTDEVNGHSHTITGHTTTNKVDGHKHRFTILTEEFVNGTGD